MKRTHGEMSAAVSEREHEVPHHLVKTHQPKISRKIRACQECQRRKIKCGIEPGESSCARCQKLGTKCVVNKSLQTLLEDECEWKEDIEQKIKQLQTAVAEILGRLNMPQVETLTPMSQSVAPRSPLSPVTNEDMSPRTRQTPLAMSLDRAGSPEITALDDAESEFAAPMSSLFEVTKLRNLRVRGTSDNEPASLSTMDFIADGRVSLQDAEELFLKFQTTLSQYLCGGVALVHNTLDGMRQSSSLLAAAVLAVAALHVQGKESVFDVTYIEFLALVGESMVDKRHSLDDLRAFCIGAFWLSDVSWKLSGHAVRIATELNVHQSFAKAVSGQVEHVERARLWYLLYVCDHHFSVAYGRPPVVSEDLAISCHETFLQLPGVTQADWRLHSQVAIFRILSRMYYEFGTDNDKAVSEADFSSLQAYDAEFDAWRAKWEPRLCPSKFLTVLPSRGVIMHWNFAKLQVNALALRGLSPRQAHLISDRRRELANIAIAQALSTLSFVLEDTTVQNAIQGVPLYLHTTVTYAAVFLLKVCMQWRTARLNLNVNLTVSLIEQIAQNLAQAKASQRHLSYHVSNGLIKMLAKFRKHEKKELLETPAAVSSVLPAFGKLDEAGGQDDWSAVTSASSDMYGDMGMYTMDQDFLPPLFFNMITQQMPG